MRNPDKAASRPAVRVLHGSTVVMAVAVVTLLSGSGTASAVQAEPNAMTFGLLGPVGMVAVVVGVLGMAAGVIRQRHKNRVEAAASAIDAEAQPPAVAQVAVVAQPPAIAQVAD